MVRAACAPPQLDLSPVVPVVVLHIHALVGLWIHQIAGGGQPELLRSVPGTTMHLEHRTRLFRSQGDIEAHALRGQGAIGSHCPGLSAFPRGTLAPLGAVAISSIGR